MNDLKMQKIIFLDRDGTLCWDKGAFHSHIYDYEELINKINVLDGVYEALSELKSRGYMLVVVSNQAGVAKGKFKEGAVHRFNYNLNKKLGFLIDGFYYCIHHDTGRESDNTILNPNKHIKQLIYDCDCRKPKAGMFFQVESDMKNGCIQVVDESLFNDEVDYVNDRTKIKKEKIEPCIIDKEQSFMIGDKLIDTIAGKKYGVKSILVRTGEGSVEEIKLNKYVDDDKKNIVDFVVDDMLSAVNKIDEISN